MLRPRAALHTNTTPPRSMTLAVAPQPVPNPEEVIEILELRELFMIAGLRRLRNQITIAKKTGVMRRRRTSPRLRVPVKRCVEKDERCTVCQDDLDDDATHTECSHAFHTQCLDQWAAENYDNPTCPVCRRLLFTPILG